MTNNASAKLPLIDLAKSNPDAFAQYAIQQIVAICGDGNLRDNSICSQQLRSFLSLQPPIKLEEYVRQCLEQKFDKSGFVLQDVINEIGLRLGYQVKNGRYQGVANDIGFDGLWDDGTNKIVVEVKTTDAYRINLDTVRSYADKLSMQDASQNARPSLLIVVGRQDTGDLEAQVRGSRHAWSTRLISADALVKLMFINEEVDDPTLVDKIRRVLVPFEYTRVDNIVDLLFQAQQEIEQKVQSVVDLVDEPSDNGQTKGQRQITPREKLRAKRLGIVDTFFEMRSLKPNRKSPTQYFASDNKLAVVCSISKRYQNESPPYWFALHQQWLDFMKSAKEGFFLLGCMDRDEAYALPISFLENHLNDLNTTEKEDHRYWRIQFAFDDDGNLALNLPKIRKKMDLTPYAFKLTKSS